MIGNSTFGTLLIDRFSHCSDKNRRFFNLPFSIIARALHLSLNQEAHLIQNSLFYSNHELSFDKC